MPMRHRRMAEQKPLPGSVINWDDNLATGLAFWAPFWEAAGSGGGTNLTGGAAGNPRVIDATGRSNSGVFGGFTKWAPGLHGRTLDFTGTTSDVEYAAGTNTQPRDAPYLGALTITCWIYLHAAQNNQIIGKAAGGGSSTCPFDFRVNSAGTLNFVRANTSFNTFTSTGTVSTGKWHFISVSVPNGLIQSAPTFGIDLAYSTPSAGSNTGAVTGTNARFSIGRRFDGGVQLNGLLDDIRIWSRVLQKSELRDVMTEWWRPALPTRTFVAGLGSAPPTPVPIGGTAALNTTANTAVQSFAQIKASARNLTGIASSRLSSASPLGAAAKLFSSASAKIKLGATFLTGGSTNLTSTSSSKLVARTFIGFARSFLTPTAGATLALQAPSLPVFPVLSPLAWSVHKKPILASRVSIGVTGRESQFAGAVFPRWAFTLTYGGSSWLRDRTQNIVPDPTKGSFTEFEQLSALFILTKGAYGEFLYDDPDDDSRAGAFGAIGDGSTQLFPIYVSWGFGPFSPSFYFPVGQVRTLDAVYFNGVLQLPGTYSLDGATRTQLFFAAPPPVGVLVTIDFSFYYRCRFLDDHLDFSQWAKNLWECKEVRFETVKA